MRIKFNSNKSMVIWGIIWCITAAIASEFELSYLFIIPVIYWTFLGSAITDLVVDKDWHGLKRFLIISTIIIAVIVIVSLYWE
ncbi:hypothetical protein [Winogradskyella sp. KYW1333]|jgi:FtsH-binding integral membrane protein|uniref:hypothetical protein n=1 Tax=Winogradskyella sp. KYW1333 TaxID=2282123 RepID=UPI000DF27194|nr:hypothetical protein [Winogradskyella sp. KYW1333]RCT54641.1 hypothetical protein DUZ96_06360 [Winogradskyella sp. KYW1333]